MNNLDFLEGKKYFLLLFSLLLINCRSDKSKDRYTSTITVCDKGLYVEIYTIFGSGAHGGDRVSNYLTDSVNFRAYVGSYDNAHENYTYKCIGDSVYIEKQSIIEEGIPNNTKSIVKVIDKKTIDLKTLKKENKFE